MTREERVGLNVLRERYEGIKQSKSRLCYEKDMLRSKLNGADVSDTNHTLIFHIFLLQVFKDCLFSR